ncbi:hypothetical protein PIIN_01397 [Serendipita indica DSM 11827]|uniref:Uncharacterized protein n=1 Tax=Serendipita indica (strain DSM 11827) TaxID=1109443 RepID=G4T8C4_SERID|nr:hypothetical protein PIIN_01397 [Serendipita indica DSM 11827]
MKDTKEHAASRLIINNNWWICICHLEIIDWNSARIPLGHLLMLFERLHEHTQFIRTTTSCCLFHHCPPATIIIITSF